VKNSSNFTTTFDHLCENDPDIDERDHGQQHTFGNYSHDEAAEDAAEEAGLPPAPPSCLCSLLAAAAAAAAVSPLSSPAALPAEAEAEADCDLDSPAQQGKKVIHCKRRARIRLTIAAFNE
jgi:hypothetical protein